MSRLVLSLDPGKHAHGCALWEGGELTAAWYQKGQGLEDAIRERVGGAYPDVVAYEFPRVYPQSRSRGGLKGQNDLLDLAFSAGRVVQALLAYEEIRFSPREWKGTTPKEIMAKRIQAKLSEDERERVELPSAKSLHHNVWDGVGIGLYYWGRL